MTEEDYYKCTQCKKLFNIWTDFYYSECEKCFLHHILNDENFDIEDYSEEYDEHIREFYYKNIHLKILK
jgi:DNA-directed RNA polymerase subunit RPC12/RpoP